MTDQSNAKPQAKQEQLPKGGEPSIEITKEMVGKYLLANPNFLIDNPDLLVQIQVQLQHNGVVSLTQIQSAQSREKIQQLKSKQEELVNYARKNEVIYKTYADLNLALAKTISVAEIETQLNEHLVGTLGLESTCLVLLNSSGASHRPLSEIQQRSLFDKKLAREPFYFGRVGNVEKDALFPDAKAESVALVLLGDNKEAAKDSDSALGLLAIASKDPLHFQPEMDTVLLEYLRQNLNHHIARLR